MKVACVGCGHWGKNLVRNFSTIGALGAVVDPAEETAKSFAQEYGVPSMSFEEAIADDGIDAVCLASPAVLHAEQAEAALNAGKHVYVEKPVALEIGDAERVVALAEKQDRVLMVGHLLQYHEIFRKLRAMVEAGELGELRYIYSNRISLGKLRTEENVLWSFAPHDLSMILSLVKEEPTRVTAEGFSYVTPGLADVAMTHLQFANCQAHVFTSWVHPFKEQRLTVIGTEGTCVFEDSEPEWSKKLVLYRHTIDTPAHGAPVPNKADAEYIDVPRGEPLRSECEHFVECVRDGKRPRTDGREGLAVLKVLQQAQQDLDKNVR